MLVLCKFLFVSETYLGAHLGAKARETNPQYETEKEVGKLRRRVKRRTISSDEEDEDDPPRKSLPSPPKINLNDNKKFKAVIGGKSPVKVTVSSSGKGLSKMPVRKDRGSKVSDIDDLKALLNARKEKAKTSQLKTSSLGKVSNVFDHVILLSHASDMELNLTKYLLASLFFIYINCHRISDS